MGPPQHMTVCFARAIAYPQLCEYVESSMDASKVEWVQHTTYTSYHCLPHIDETTRKVIFVQMAPNLELLEQLRARKIQVWVLNTEQMSRVVAARGEEVGFDFEGMLLAYVRPIMRVQVMDYSAANVAVWNKICPHILVELVPFVPRSPMQWPLADRTRSIAFVGDVSSTHRATILQQLESDGLQIIKDFGKRRDAQLAACKVLLNVHYGPSYQVFEELRCLPCVLNKMVVVSETSLLPMSHPLHKFIVFAPHERLGRCVKRAVQKYDELFTKLYVNNPAHDTLLADIAAWSTAFNACNASSLSEA